jgi:hypothetical protein
MVTLSLVRIAATQKLIHQLAIKMPTIIYLSQYHYTLRQKRTGHSHIPLGSSIPIPQQHFLFQLQCQALVVGAEQVNILAYSIDRHGPVC